MTMIVRNNTKILRAPVQLIVLYGGAFLAIVAIWEALVLTVFRGSSIFPAPQDVFHALFVEMSWSEILRDCAVSLSRVAVGATSAIAAGIALGLFCSSLPRLGQFFGAVIEYFRPIPPIAWIPLAILWFGIGEMPSYFIIFLGAFFPVFTNSLAGAQSVSRVHRDPTGPGPVRQSIAPPKCGIPRITARQYRSGTRESARQSRSGPYATTPCSCADLDSRARAAVPDGCVDAFDLGALLAAWCSVAGGNPCDTCFP